MKVHGNSSVPTQGRAAPPTICKKRHEPSPAKATLSIDEITEKLAVMAREERLSPDLIPLWEDVKEMRASNLGAALDQIEMNLKREVVMGEAERVATTLWIAQTYVYEAFKLASRLFVTSANPGSGKSTLLSLVAQMSNGGVHRIKVSEAYLGRLKDDKGEKLMVALDQLDNAFDARSTSAGPMIDRLIAGADRGAKQGLVEKIDGGFKPVDYDLFYPMALGKIGVLPSPALRSRCIVIQMHPASVAEAEELLKHSKGQANPNIRPLLMKVMSGRAEELAAANPTIPTDLINRGADKWRPLLAIAEAAGGDWPKRALEAAHELEGEEEEQPPHVILLSKLVSITKDWPYEEIFSEELDSALSKLAASEKAAQWSAKQRGHLLKLVGLKAERHWREGKQLRGYRISDIRAQADKYLQPDTCDG